MVIVNTFTICLNLNFNFAVLHLEDNAILVMGFYLPKYESKVPFDLNTQIENGEIFLEKFRTFFRKIRKFLWCLNG